MSTGTTRKPAGWLHRDEQTALSKLARGRHVLEVGGWQGLSTTVIGQVAAHVVTVDTWLGDAFTEAVAGPRKRSELLPKWLANIEAALELDRVAPMAGDLHRLLPCLAPEHFGLIFYDADHAPRPTRFALDWAWRGCLMREDQGKPWAIAVHDYKPKNPKYTETNQQIDRWAADRGLAPTFAVSLAIFQGGTNPIDF